MLKFDENDFLRYSAFSETLVSNGMPRSNAFKGT